MEHIPQRVVEEYRESLKSDHLSRQFHLKYPDFCDKTMDYFERMGRFAENAATKDDLKRISDTLDEHETRISGLESLKDDIKNVIHIAAEFSRWKDKALKLCVIGFFVMLFKSVGVPDFIIKALIASVGG